MGGMRRNAVEGEMSAFAPGPDRSESKLQSGASLCAAKLAQRHRRFFATFLLHTI
jgi:hypothetical protein